MDSRDTGATVHFMNNAKYASIFVTMDFKSHMRTRLY